MKNKILFLFSIIFYISGNSQTQLGAPISGAAPGDESGYVVKLAADGKTLAVGDHYYDITGEPNVGRIRVFILDGTDNWIQIGTDITGSISDDNAGASVALSADGRTLVAGIPGFDDIDFDMGIVRVYEWDSISTDWLQKGSNILGTLGGEKAGYATDISADGSRVIVSGLGGFFSNNGKVRVFEWDTITSDWMQKGSEFTSTENGSFFGNGVSISSDGNTFAIGAPWQDEGGYNRGAAIVYSWNNDSLDWIQKGGRFVGTSNENELGWHLCLSADGNTIAIPSPKDPTTNSLGGMVQVYTWDSTGSIWLQKGTDIRELKNNAFFGSDLSLSASGDTLAVGMLDNNYTGSFKIFEWKNNAWSQKGTTIKGEAKNDFFSFSISLSSREGHIAVGAIWNDDNGDNSGKTTVYDMCGSRVIDSRTACSSYTWINGITYTSDNDTSYLMYTNAAGCDSIVILDLKLLNNTNTDYVYSCGPFTWIDGNTYTTDNSVATYTLTNSHGCDSAITLNLVIDTTLNNLERTVSSTIINTCDTSFTTISINNSQTNINYYLFNDVTGSLITGPLTGNGDTISFMNDTSYNDISYRIDAKMEANNYITQFDTTLYLQNHPKKFPADSSEYTFEVWFRVRPQDVFSGGNYGLISCGDWVLGTGCAIYFNSSEDGVLDNIAGFGTGSTYIDVNVANTADNRWHHMAQTRIDSVQYFFLDGTLLDSVITHDYTIAPDSSFTLGWIDLVDVFKGDIDEVRVWKTGKTSQEINYLMHHSPEPSADTNLVAYWDFSDGSGSIIYDRTENDNDLIYSGNWNSGGYKDGDCQYSLSTITNVSVKKSSFFTDTVFACNSYLWIDGNTYTSSNDTATYTLSSAATNGCDSIVTLNLTILPVPDTSVTVNGAVFMANGSGLSYQWVDCNNNNQAISGATNQSYTPSANGSYAVIVSNSGCSDTSYCYIITNVGIDEQEFGSNAKIYPNPSNGAFNIDVNKTTNCKILSPMGQVVYSGKLTEGKHDIDLSELSSGIYFVQLEYEYNTAYQFVVISR